MDDRMHYSVWAVPLVIIGSIAYLMYKDHGLAWPPSLDFTGGVRLEYRINDADAIRKGLETSAEREQALRQSQEAFLFRLREFDLSEIIVKPVGDNRLIVEVPGTGGIDRVKQGIGRAAVLTFRLVLDDGISAEELIQKAPSERQDYYPYKGADLYLKVGEPLLDASAVSYKGTRAERFGAAYAENVPTKTGDSKEEAFVRLELNSQAQATFADMTNKYFQRRLAICLDNLIESAPLVADKGISNPIITGNFRMSEAEELAKILRAGPLPVSLDLASQNLISASLGKESLKQGLIALAAGTLFVVTILGLSYSNHGAMLATFVICMLLQSMVIYILGRNSWLTLNMVSLSGLIVLIGISVDSLILVFEEYRSIVSEESAYQPSAWLRKLRQAFVSQKPIILLANFTTLATLAGLYFIEGPIRDLVKALVLGILVAVVINVWFANHLLTWDKFTLPLERTKSLRKPLLALRFNIFTHSRRLLAIYLLAFAVSGALLYSRGVEFALDLKGGTEIKMLSDEGVGTENLRGYAQAYFGERCEIKQVSSLSSSQIQGFEYIIRVLRAETLAAKASGDSRGSEAQNSTGTTATAEGFVDYVRKQTPTAIHLASVDLLGPTVITGQRNIIVGSLVAGILLLTVLLSIFYNFSYAIPVILAFIMDGLITVGAISLFHVPLSLPVVAAVLTVIGYSINDSIVVSGHVARAWKGAESSLQGQSEARLKQAIDHPLEAIREYLQPTFSALSSRVLLTSATVAGAASALLIFGRDVVNDFGLAITVGAIAGTISSVAIVSIWLERLHAKQMRNLAEGEQQRRKTDSKTLGAS